MMEPVKALEDKVYEEFLSHLKEDDSNVPFPHDGFWYYSRTHKGEPASLVFFPLGLPTLVADPTQ